MTLISSRLILLAIYMEGCAQELRTLDTDEARQIVALSSVPAMEANVWESLPL